MPRECPDAAAVGAGLLATVSVAVAALRQHLTDADPKVALRAVAELTKLLSVCARHGIAVGETEEVAGPQVSPPATPMTEAEPADPARTRERRNDEAPLPARPAPEAPSKTPLRGSRGSQDPPLALPAACPLPPGGRTLTSFLGANSG